VKDNLSTVNYKQEETQKNKKRKNKRQGKTKHKTLVILDNTDTKEKQKK